MDKSFGFAVQTKWKIVALEEKFGIKSGRIVYWPNGTDIEKYQLDISLSEARKKLDLPQDKKLVLYTGQLFDWKGVDTLIQAVDFLGRDILVYVVGGSAEDVVKLKKGFPIANDERIVFVPFQPRELMPVWLKAADVLILPNTGKQKVSLYYTSPMKLFEYMASGKPIVASAIPSILEILNKDNSLLAEADNPASFGEKINYALRHLDEVSTLGLQAQRDVKKYTWRERARKISEKFIK
jgi:glycosyltransferase involved in cell wall biosynthesis